MPTVQTYGYRNPTVCNDFDFGIITNPVPGVNTDKFASEHILDFQMITQFFNELHADLGPGLFTDPRPGKTGNGVKFCTWLKPYFSDILAAQQPTCDGVRRTPLQCVLYQYPGYDSNYNAEFVLLDSGVNTAKEGVSPLPYSCDSEQS
jgi:chitinase